MATGRRRINEYNDTRIVFQHTKYLEKDKKLFDTPMENKLSLTLRKKKEWLHSVFTAQTRKRKYERRRKQVEALSDI